MSKPVPRAIVGALIFDENRQLFLMRSSGKYGSQWIVPGGKIDFGETILNALKREIREETGLILKDIEFKGIRELIEPDRHFIFLEHTATAINTNQVILNSEATEYGWFTKNNLDKIDIAKPTLELIQDYWR